MKVLKKIFKGVFYCFSGINSHNWAYKLVALIGLILRVSLLPILIPNVFEVIADIFISQLNFQPWLYEIVIRLILFIVDALALSNLFYWITFACVGNFYDSGSNPVWGSISYTIYYFIHMFIPVLLIQHFTWLAIILTFVIYALISGIFYFVSSKLDTLSDSWIFRLVLHCVIWAVVFVIVILLKVYVF